LPSLYLQSKLHHLSISAYSSFARSSCNDQKALLLSTSKETDVKTQILYSNIHLFDLLLGYSKHCRDP
jgi:hypothetical protein